MEYQRQSVELEINDFNGWNMYAVSMLIQHATCLCTQILVGWWWLVANRLLATVFFKWQNVHCNKMLASSMVATHWVYSRLPR